MSKTDSENNAALKLDSVTMAFGGLVAVDDVSIVAPRGTRGAIIGPNGAGKTTLFRIISGELAPTSGKTFLFGQDATGWPAYRRARFGLGRTYQVTNVFAQLTVEENVVLAAQAVTPTRYRSWLPLRVSGDLSHDVEQALRLARMTDLGPTTAGELSHGQQRQLELAMALVSDPKLLLLDEPAAGLTSSERELISQLVLGLSEDITILVIEHDLDLAFGLSERIICMNNGSIIADGSPDEIRGNEDVQKVYMGVE